MITHFRTTKKRPARHPSSVRAMTSVDSPRLAHSWPASGSSPQCTLPAHEISVASPGRSSCHRPGGSTESKKRREERIDTRILVERSMRCKLDDPTRNPGERALRTNALPSTHYCIKELDSQPFPYYFIRSIFMVDW